MITKPLQYFESECGRARVCVENDMPIGVFHDFLMLLKGEMVDRMVKAHKEQQEQAEEAVKDDILPSESELPLEEKPTQE